MKNKTKKNNKQTKIRRMIYAIGCVVLLQITIHVEGFFCDNVAIELGT